MEGVRTSLLWISVSTVIFIISLLCLMDLPWNMIFKTASKKVKEIKEKRAQEKIDQTTVQSYSTEATIAKTHVDLINSETDILKKLQNTLRSLTKLGDSANTIGVTSATNHPNPTSNRLDD